jgi:hypothetical protein
MLALVSLRGSSSSCAGWFEPVVTEPDVVSGVPTVAVQAVPGRAVMAGAGSHVLRHAAFLDDQQVRRTVARGLAGVAGGRRWCRFWKLLAPHGSSASGATIIEPMKPLP